MAVLTQYFPPEYSGAGIQLAAVVDRLRRRGIAFRVLTCGSEASDTRPGDGLHVRRFRARGAGVAGDLVFGAQAGAWLLGHGGWDLLHAIDFSYPSLLPLAVARARRRPVLVKTTLLEDEASTSLGARLHHGVRGLGYRGADAVVALSDALEEGLRARYGVRREILRIPNGVDTARFRPPEADERARERRALGIPGEAFVALLCGMRIARKNALALVGAAARMGHRPVHVVLLGPPGEDPAYEERLRAAIAALPEGKTAQVVDGLPADGVARALRAADVYVLPSQGEGMPNSVLEAMATGLPTVATDIPGSRDVLADGGGRLVPLGDEAALAQALDALAGDAEARARLGREALGLARERYALDRVADRYAAAYAALLGVAPFDAAR